MPRYTVWATNKRKRILPIEGVLLYSEESLQLFFKRLRKLGCRVARFSSENRLGQSEYKMTLADGNVLFLMVQKTVERDPNIEADEFLSLIPGRTTPRC
jgi:hypothetical protein